MLLSDEAAISEEMRSSAMAPCLVIKARSRTTQRSNPRREICMPELPEVELISRSLHALVKGRTINSAELLRERLAPDTPPREFSKKLHKSAINFVHRRGKHI